LGNDAETLEEDDINTETYDKYIRAEVTLDTAEGLMHATVKRTVTDVMRRHSENVTQINCQEEGRQEDGGFLSVAMMDHCNGLVCGT
jgi:hypothetical protein